MIFDASYGDAEETQGRQRGVLADMAENGPVLLPVPADGRGPEIAIFLQQAGFGVAIDDAVRAVAILLMQSARASAKPGSLAALERLIGDARPLAADAAPAAVMVAHGGSGDVGIAAALIARWRDQSNPAIVFTGHLPAGSTGRKLVDSGRARFQRWNVHPTFGQNSAADRECQSAPRHAGLRRSARVPDLAHGCRAAGGDHIEGDGAVSVGRNRFIAPADRGIAPRGADCLVRPMAQ